MQTIAAKAATCTEAGNNKYYYCPDCKKYFKDAEGKTETTVAAETIAATAHSKMQTIAAKAATCTEDGNNKYYYCPDCKKYFKDAEGKTETTVAAETIKASHNFSTEWSSDAEYHWKDCTVGCGTIIEKAAHSGGEATCVSKAHCEICGEEYGDVDPTNHKGTTYLVGAKDPQVGVKGYTGDVYCSDCHQKISDGEDIDALLPVAVTGVEVTPASVSLEKEGTQQLNVNVLPANAYDKSVTFTSDKPGVATVSSTGLITALGEGTATITVKTTDGEKTATCAVTVTHKHTMQKINAVAPTCTAAGNNEYYYCTDCKKYYKDAQGKTETTVAAETLDAINHANMQTIDAKPATCTEAGNNKYYYCPDCKKYFKDAEGTTETTVAAETISATGHTHMQEIEAKPATCTEAGNNKYYYCSDCKKYFKDAEGKTETTVEAETVAATAHANMQKIDAVAPTCTEAGNNEYYFCPDCNKYFKDAHGKTETTVAAETLDAINHANVQEIAAKDPSCTENGNIKYYYCPDCKKYFTDAELTNETTLDDVTIPATGHNNMQEIEAKPATCTEDGNNKYYYCPDCKKYFKDAEGKTETTPDDEIIKAGHTLPDEWTSDENEHWKVCTVVGCGSIVDKAAHSGGEATCVSKAHCEVCGTEYGEIDPDNHKGDTYLVGAKEAQIGVEGYTGDVYCSDCKKMIEEGKVIDALKEEDTDSSDSSSDTEGDVSDNSSDTSDSSDSDSVSDSNDSSSSGTDSNTSSSQADSSSSSSADSSKANSSGTSSADSSKANSSGTSSAANNNGTSTNPATGAASAFALVTLAALGGVVVAKRKK